jgi:glutamate/tyrosine decarboxylase-like PLP-dependent enzyme
MSRTLTRLRRLLQVVAQYYNFLRLGFHGYRRVQGYARQVATHLVTDRGTHCIMTAGMPTITSHTTKCDFD